MALAQGDIVIVEGTESRNSFAILALTNFAEGQVVRFTSSKWDITAGGFVDQKNYIEWTVPVGGLATGERVIFSECDESVWHTGSAEDHCSNSFGSPVTVGQVHAISHRELFAFQGQPANPTVVFGGKGNNTSKSEEPVELNSSFDIICFTPGTLILTPFGNKRVEDLRVGDLVATLDNGLQPIRWIGRKYLTGARLFASPHFLPIKILAGSLGENLPERDMWVSPKHRILLNNPETSTVFGETEVLTPAKGMCDGKGIFHDTTRTSVEYIHILFDQHEIVFANGVMMESFHPGERSIAGLTLEARDELLKIFPALKSNPDMFGPLARSILSTVEMQKHVQAGRGHWQAGSPVPRVMSRL